MLVLRCTTKAFKKIGGKPRSIEVSTTEPTFGEWYVNTVDFLNRSDLLLACMHAESLYVLFVPIGPKVTAEQLVTGLQARLLGRLLELETPPDAAKRVVASYRGSAILAKTTDRRIMGHFNSALGNMDCMLGMPRSGLWDGNKLLGPRVEHRLNYTPRGVTGKNVIWPLPSFWQSARRLCPELPARAPLGLVYLQNRDELRQAGHVLYDHLPERLAGKLYATFQEVDVLYTVEELQTLADALDRLPALRNGLPAQIGEYLPRQVRVRIERLLTGQRSP